MEDIVEVMLYAAQLLHPFEKNADMHLMVAYGLPVAGDGIQAKGDYYKHNQYHKR